MHVEITNLDQNFIAHCICLLEARETKRCFTNALKKFCEHTLPGSLALQNRRLSEAGYPQPFPVSVAEGLLQKKIKKVRRSEKKGVTG